MTIDLNNLDWDTCTEEEALELARSGFRNGREDKAEAIFRKGRSLGMSMQEAVQYAVTACTEDALTDEQAMEVLNKFPFTWARTSIVNLYWEIRNREGTSPYIAMILVSAAVDRQKEELTTMNLIYKLLGAE
jgi:hypothetical protein